MQRVGFLAVRLVNLAHLARCLRWDDETVEDGGEQVAGYGAGIDEAFKGEAVGEAEDDRRPSSSRNACVLPESLFGVLGEVGDGLPQTAPGCGEEPVCIRVADGEQPEFDVEQLPVLALRR